MTSGEQSQALPTTPQAAISMGLDVYYVPLPPMPPGMEEALGPQPPIAVKVPAAYFSTQTAQVMDSGTSSSSSLTSGRAVTTVQKGNAGTVGIAYQGHHPSGKDLNEHWLGPDDGLFGTVPLENEYMLYRPYGKIRVASKVANGFSKGMKKGGFKTSFKLGDNDLKGVHLRSSFWGGNNVFNTANLGLLVGHGIRGMDYDYTTGWPGFKNSYYPVYRSGNHFYDWVRLTEMEFGSANLRWMAIYSCNNLNDFTYDDLWWKESLPINDYLHLLLGTKTTVFIVADFGKKFADALTGESLGTPLQVDDSWFYAGVTTQIHVRPQISIVFRVAGWINCFSDTVYSWEDPESGNPGDIADEIYTVYSP